MKYIAFLALFALIACGADGAPERPSAKPGVAITGEAEIGISNNTKNQ